MKTCLTIFAALVLLAAGRAKAAFTLTPGVQSGVKSNAATFTGAVNNTNLTDAVFLNDIQITFTGIATNYLSANTNSFFANVPGLLLPGETYSDIVFAVAISSNTPAGNYFGTVTIRGGTNIVAANNLGSLPFQITAFDTPFAVWRAAKFGTNATDDAISGDLADPDGDGTVNLLEYAFELDPNTASPTGLPIGEGETSCDCLALTYTKVLAATDLVYTPEAADNPGGPWSTNGITQAFIDADSFALTIRASDAGNPISTTGKRFLHLRVTRAP